MPWLALPPNGHEGQEAVPAGREPRWDLPPSAPVEGANARPRLVTRHKWKASNVGCVPAFSPFTSDDWNLATMLNTPFRSRSSWRVHRLGRVQQDEENSVRVAHALQSAAVA